MAPIAFLQLLLKTGHLFFRRQGFAFCKLAMPCLRNAFGSFGNLSLGIIVGRIGLLYNVGHNLPNTIMKRAGCHPRCITLQNQVIA